MKIKMFQSMLIVIIVLLCGVSAYPADILLKWDATAEAAGYKVYYSNDSGTTWALQEDVGSMTSYLFEGVSESGLVLFRVSAYNQAGESVRYEYGAWYNHLWRPLSAPAGTAVIE